MDHPASNNQPHSNIDVFLEKLNALSPSDILNNEIARSCFTAFLQRDTAETCWQLLPETYRSLLFKASRSAPAPASDQTLSNPNLWKASKSVHTPTVGQTCSKPNLSRAPKSAHAPALDQTSSRPRNTSLALSSDDHVFQHFKSFLNDQKQVNRLVRAVSAFKEAKQQPITVYKQIWSSKDGIFNQNALARERRLYLGRDQIGKGGDQYALAHRLTLLFVAAEIDWSHPKIASRPKKGSLKNRPKLSPGVGQLSVALKQVSERAGVPVDALKEDYRRSRNYFELLQMGGPGSLLELGSAVANHWEREMIQDDIPLLIDYRRSYLPDICKRARELDIIASEAIIQGLITYGWKWDEILSPHAPPLVKQIDLHLQKYASSLRKIREENKIELCQYSNRKKREGSNLEQQCAKRPCTIMRGDENAALPCPCCQVEKPVDQAQDAGNSVPGAQVLDQCVEGNLEFDPQIGEGFRGNWVPVPDLPGLLDPQIGESLHIAGDWVPAPDLPELRDPQIGDPQIGEGFRGNWVPASDLPGLLDPQIGESFRIAVDWVPAHDLPELLDPRIGEGFRIASNPDDWTSAPNLPGLLDPQIGESFRAADNWVPTPDLPDLLGPRIGEGFHIAGNSDNGMLTPGITDLLDPQIGEGFRVAGSSGGWMLASDLLGLRIGEGVRVAGNFDNLMLAGDS